MKQGQTTQSPCSWASSKCLAIANEGLYAFSMSIPSSIHIEERFNVYHSFKRGATTRAKEQGVDKPTIEMNNR
jgi:hypothetical protein